jgi:hypothetical protein
MDKEQKTTLIIMATGVAGLILMVFAFGAYRAFA